MTFVAGSLEALGWNGWFEAMFAEHAPPGAVPGRVMTTHRETSIVRVADGDVAASVSGRFRSQAFGPGDFPAVGDWVALDARVAERSGTIHAVLPRRSAISRTAGDSNRRGAARVGDEQVLAANVDIAFLVAAIDRPPNLRRLERYLALAWASSATPVVVLNKADAAPDIEAAVAAVESIALAVDILTTSAVDGSGVEAVRQQLGAGRTAVVLGPSGVGKSTLVNALLGHERQATAAIRASDGRGRHTTTHRELIELPGGAMLVDTPGIRSLELLDGDEGIDATYADIAALAADCRFPDCSHGPEPGCAVQAALASGELDPARYAGFEKLRREAARAVRERDPLARDAERRRWKAIHKSVGIHMKAKYGARQTP